MSAANLLDLLRRCRLLDDSALARLADAWPPDAAADECVAGLRRAGLLTSYQAEQLLARKPGRLRIGPYRLLARLGAGGGGVVYKAEHVLLNRVVALKVMKRRRVAVGRAEARTTAALSHPNIV